MSSFNTTLNEKKQFIIAIKVVKPFDSEVYLKGEAEDLFAKTIAKRALIDTGASNTCIAQEYADELNLIPIGKTTITTASNRCDVNRYIIDFAIPVATTALKEASRSGGFEQTLINEKHWAHTQQSVHAIPTIGRDRGFDAILGMDVLAKMHITLFQEQIIMSF